MKSKRWVRPSNYNIKKTVNLMAAASVISNEHFLTEHQEGAKELHSKINKTQKDHAVLNALMNGLDHFDRYSSFSNLMCRFVLMGTHSKNGITLAAVNGGAYVWLSVGIVGTALAVIGSAVDHNNRKKGLEATLAECEAVLSEIEAYQEKHDMEALSNIELLEEILEKGISPQSRKIRRMLATVLGKSPYDIDFDILRDEFERASDFESQDLEYKGIDFELHKAPKKKVTAKQVVSYIVNFIASFGTGSGFVYWGAYMFGAAVPYGWALLLAGVLVGIVVGTIFMVQQIRMEQMHQPIDERAKNFLQSLILNKALQKQLKKINERENEIEYREQYDPVEFSDEDVAEGREHLYLEKVPSARKHLSRAGTIGYNSVLGFVIGFGLVMTFAFITGGAALIPSIIVGLAFSGYFIYSGADQCLTAEKEEEEKRTQLRKANIDYRTHWEHHQSPGYNPEEQLNKSVPQLLLDLVQTFDNQDIRNRKNTNFRKHKQVLALVSQIANIRMYVDGELTEDFFNNLYAYFLTELSEEIEQEEISSNAIKTAVLMMKSKILGNYDEDVREPHIPETLKEKFVHWAKNTFTRENIPKGIKRTFMILGILTLGAAIPFMAMSGGVILPVALGIFMLLVLAAYVVREVMEYKRAQELALMDDELNKYEIIDCTRKLLKPDKYLDLRAEQENIAEVQEEKTNKKTIEKADDLKSGSRKRKWGESKSSQHHWYRCFRKRNKDRFDDESSIEETYNSAVESRA